jgi:hypothetical protein
MHTHITTLVTPQRRTFFACPPEASTPACFARFRHGVSAPSSSTSLGSAVSYMISPMHWLLSERRANCLPREHPLHVLRHRYHHGHTQSLTVMLPPTDTVGWSVICQHLFTRWNIPGRLECVPTKLPCKGSCLRLRDVNQLDVDLLSHTCKAVTL